MLAPHQNGYLTCPTPTKTLPTLGLERDLFLKSFFIGKALGFRRTQSTPSKLSGVIIYFFIRVSFTTFFVGSTTVIQGGYSIHKLKSNLSQRMGL
jgi:hypothetical protein